ncbi:MAG: heavy metal translocating P-type ATPase, partial [Deinococcota bacterium]|nr:heavy metal translocating P-type ATPase [Deinococcota bacterium]
PEPGHKHHTDHGRGGGGHDKHAGHSSEFKNRFWLSLALSLPVVYYAAFFQDVFGYRALQFPGSAWVGPVLGTVLYFYGGWPFLQGAVHELRARQPGMMTLVALAISVAFGYSVAVTLGLPGTPFYWELATLVVIMLLGHWLEMASVQRAGRALEHLASLVPSTAHKFAGEKLEDVSVTGLRTGDRILIRPGEQVPVDGVVREGASSLNEAFLTGESRPVSKSVGDEVIAGAVNGEGALTAEVTRTGDDTTLSQIQRLVAEAQGSRSRFQNLADRAAAWLFYLALVAGTLTFVVWFAVADLQTAITRAVTVLVIACPHALGLAIPLVTVNATAMSAKNGILVRNREAFERARDLKIVAFDKTGTLTQGQPLVTDIVPFTMSPRQLLELAGAVEATSAHPLAHAIVQRARADKLDLAEASDARALPGKAVEGTVKGQQVVIASPRYAADLTHLSDAQQVQMQALEEDGKTVVVVVIEGEAAGFIALRDEPRTDAHKTIRVLRDLGIKSLMLTGDNHRTAQAIGRELGLEVQAELLPEDKHRFIRELGAGERIAMVGDGINDAPALAQADVGIAMGGGTDVALETAHVALLRPSMLAVVELVKLARATMRNIRVNIAIALGLKAVFLVTTLLGVTGLWAAILADTGATALVTANALRLLGFRGDKV